MINIYKQGHDTWSYIPYALIHQLAQCLFLVTQFYNEKLISVFRLYFVSV